MDADGYLTITGRLREIINRGARRYRRARSTKSCWTTLQSSSA